MKRIFSCLIVFAIIIVSCKKDKPKTAPSVTTAALTNVTTTSATAGGTITSDGNVAVTASGIVLSKVHATPTLTDTVMSGTTASGSFTINLTNLDFGTTYYIRAYATNSIGTGYGNVVTLNTTNDTTKVRFTYNGQQVIYGVITSPTTGRKWMDRNLGASEVATSLTDDKAYGDLFQWGRLADGHQLRTSGTTAVLSSTDVPGHSNFILGNTAGANPTYDWRNPQNDNLWQGSSGVNNPCPSGWHVPTQNEWAAETGITSTTSAFNQLKMTLCGGRFFIDGSIVGAGSGGDGEYQTSTKETNYNIEFLIYGNSAFFPSTGARSAGAAVRCIKD